MTQQFHFLSTTSVQNCICAPIFIMALLNFKTWKQTKWVKKLWYTHTKFYLACKKYEDMQFAVLWLGLEMIMLSEIRKYKIENGHCYVWDLYNHNRWIPRAQGQQKWPAVKSLPQGIIGWWGENVNRKKQTVW